MRWITIVIFVMVCFVPGAVTAAENLTPSGIQLKDLESYIDEYVEDYIGSTVAGATIVVIKDNQIVLSKGYGYADIKNNTPMDPSTSVLEWGSITKLFVWISVMQLVEQGKIELDEDIRNYLPQGFLTKLTYDEPITMLHLMNHNAGFEDNLFDLGYVSQDKVKSLEEGLKIAEPNQIYPPGEVVAYSNFSTSLAAYITEQITGKKFYEYVSEHILRKIGMDHTSIHLPVEEDQEIIDHVTKGYELRGLGEFRESTPFYMSMYPSGAMNGTAEDLALFAMELMPRAGEKSVLFENENTLNRMFSTSYSPAEHVPGIAHGFWEIDGRSKGYAHSGNTASFSTNFHIIPEENFAVIILTNQAGETDLTFGLTKALIGENLFNPVRDAPHSSEVEGSYMSARKMGSGFSHVYYYLSPLKVRSLNPDELEVSMMGMKAHYIQEDPYTYLFVKGDSAFLQMPILHFQLENGMVKQVSTTYSDFLPMDGKEKWLVPHSILFLVCTVFFPIALFVWAIRYMRSKAINKMEKWKGLLYISGTVLVINGITLVVRVLLNSNRAYSEILLHLVINYLFTFTSFLSIGFIIWYLRKVKQTKSHVFSLILSIVSSLILIGILIYWQFYF